MRIALAIVALAALSLPVHAQQQTRWHQYTEKFLKPANPVEIKLASYVGGTGTEWLAGAAFQPDGTLVVTGTVIEPELSLNGKQVPLLNMAASAAPQQPKAPSSPAGASAKRERPDWSRRDGAPFVAWINNELTRSVRLPPGSGSACGMAIDANGDLYIAGCAGAALAGTDVSADGADRNKGLVYLLKLAADGSRVQWVRTFADAGNGVRVRHHSGKIMVEAEWAYVFQPDGTLFRVVKCDPAKQTKAVSPVDWSVAYGWDSNTNTGREPWRRPWLRIQPSPESGKKDTFLFPWDPKLVGTNKYRLVSDSSIRGIYFSDAGNMHLVGWSDGGNTVFERQPLDLDERVPADKLGFSTWGANAGSFAHLMAIDGQSWRTTSKTLWSGYLTGKNRPAGGSINNFAVATDGSLLLTGDMSFGLIQTGDNLSPEKGNAGGSYITVLRPDSSSIRFSSAILAAGKVRLHGLHAWAPQWNIATAVVKGRHLAAFVSGAQATESRLIDGAATPVAAPQRHPIQKAYGGGDYDGYVLVLDLGEAKAVPK